MNLGREKDNSKPALRDLHARTARKTDIASCEKAGCYGSGNNGKNANPPILSGIRTVWSTPPVLGTGDHWFKSSIPDHVGH